MDRRNIVLTGFMGTGKTSVGRALAELLGREFVDMDAVIAAREQMSIAELFATWGEAHFRARERELCRELAARENLVIATGGGAWVDAANRAAFSQAHVICLDASVDEILRRLADADDRPLLQAPSVEDSRSGQVGGASIRAVRNDDRRARIESLLRARREAYAQILLHIPTDGRAPDEIAREIAARIAARQAPLRELTVRTPDGAYPIFLGHGVLAKSGELAARLPLAKRGAVVTNPTVGARYAERLCAALREHGFDPVVIEIPDGEPYKTLDTVRTLYDRFIEAKMERRSPVFALGGGVIGDTAGFAAATYLRGVPLIQIPTTLLAMVDASVGGKVAVDHPAGKNLIGAFKFPHAVISDLEVLDSLPVDEYRAGMAEVIKHAIIGDAELFAALETRWLDGDLLARALQVKIQIVERDPFEVHERAHLNLGHTFGHALEKLAEFRLRHGDAVAMGIAVAARLAANLRLCDTTTRDAILALLARQQLPTRLPGEFAPARIWEAMGTDKKVRDGKLRLILPRAIGQIEIVEDVPRAEILRALDESQ